MPTALDFPSEFETEVQRLARLLLIVGGRKFWHGFEFQVFYGRRPTPSEWDDYWHNSGFKG